MPDEPVIITKPDLAGRDARARLRTRARIHIPLSDVEIEVYAEEEPPEATPS